MLEGTFKSRTIGVAFVAFAALSLLFALQANHADAAGARNAAGLTVPATVAFDAATKQKLPQKVSAQDFTFPQNIPAGQFNGKAVMLTMKDGRMVWVRALHVEFDATVIDCAKLASGVSAQKDHSTIGSGVECKK